MVLGQLVTEQIGLENGIRPVILKLTIVGVRHCLLTAGSWSQHLQPTEVGALSVVAHPDIRQCLSFLFFGLALLLVSQPAAAVYHLTHSITSAVRSLLPEVSHLIPCFHSGRREWQSPRMGRLALSREEHAPALSAQRHQPKLCPNFFLHNLHTRTLCRHVRSSHIT